MTIDPAGTHAVGRALEGPGSEYTAKWRAQGPRQHIGIAIPQKGRTFAARGAVQGHVQDQAHVTGGDAIAKDRTGPAQ